MQTQAAPRTRVRFFILSLLTIGTMINYLDRTVLGIAAPSLTKELGFSAATMGIVFSAFSWTYTAMQIPGGIFLDRFGTKLTYFLSLTFWSLSTLLHGLVTNLASLLTFRFALGVSEAPCFPTNSRVVATWFPQQERAFATGVYTVGEYVGLAFLSPLLFWIMGAFGWRALFVVAGVAGILFGLVWWRSYREPHESEAVNQSELDYIAAGGGIVTPKSANAKFEWRLVGQLLRFRQLVGICIGQFAGNSTLAFFAQGMAALGWTLVSDIAPKGMLGLTGGIFNFAANLAGIITPLVIGFIVAATGSFVGALMFIAIVALVGAFSYVFIVGDIHRIELE